MAPSSRARKAPSTTCATWYHDTGFPRCAESWARMPATFALPSLQTIGTLPATRTTTTKGQE